MKPFQLPLFFTQLYLNYFRQLFESNLTRISLNVVVAVLTIMVMPAQAVDCPSQDVDLLSQAAVNDFAGLNCNVITGNLTIGRTSIGNTDINNLAGLSGLTAVGGDVIIEKNPSLNNLTGLDQLSSIGNRLLLSESEGLSSLEGLGQLTSVVGTLSVSRNPVLSSLAGLGRLTSVGSLEVVDNDTLANLAGLEQVTSVGGDLIIERNSFLANLAGLEQITSVGGDLAIENNSFLASLAGLERITSVGGELIIRSNNQLRKLAGLGRLTSVGMRINIEHNDSLSSLVGLGQLVSGGGLLIVSDNDVLSDCSAILPLLDSVDDGDIGPGPGKASPDVRGLIAIRQNDVGCNDITQILARAQRPQLPSGELGILSVASSDAGCALDAGASYMPVSAVSPAPPANLNFVDGVAEFSISGCSANGASVDVSIDYGRDLAPGTSYWKSGTPWQEIPSTINGSVITYTLVDGGIGDEDGVANGVIVDPGGAALMAMLSGGVLAVPVNSPWLLLFLATGLVGLSGALVKRRSKRT